METAKKMQAGKPGQLTRGTRINNLSTYISGGNGSRQESVWSAAVLPGAQKYCDFPIEANQIAFAVSLSAADAPLLATFNYCGEVGTAVIDGIVAALKANPNINALGNWFNDAGFLKFVSAYPGISVDLAAIFSRANFEFAQLTNLAGEGYNLYQFKPGTLAHYIPGESLGLSGRRSLYPPTQDPSTAGATQRIAGIVIECDMHEMATGYPVYPNFDNSNSACTPPPSCYKVLSESGAPVVIALEAPYDATQTQLYYRTALDASGGELGMFRFGEAPGCIPVPFGYEILSFDFGAYAAEIEIKPFTYGTGSGVQPPQPVQGAFIIGDSGAVLGDSAGNQLIY